MSDLGLSISPSTVDPPSVSSMPSGTTKVVTFAFSFFALLFLLGLSGAHCFRLSQQRVQWVIKTPELGLLQLQNTNIINCHNMEVVSLPDTLPLLLARPDGNLSLLLLLLLTICPVHALHHLVGHELLGAVTLVCGRVAVVR